MNKKKSSTSSRESVCVLSNVTITNGLIHLTATEKRDEKFFIYVLQLSVVVIPAVLRGTTRIVVHFEHLCLVFDKILKKVNVCHEIDPVSILISHRYCSIRNELEI